MSDPNVPPAADDAKKAAAAAKKATADAAEKATTAAKKTTSAAKKPASTAKKAAAETGEIVDSAKQSLADAEVAASKAAEATKDAAAQMPAPAAPVAPAAPIFVQAPAAPRVRGNRLTAGLIGILAAAVFGVIYIGFLAFFQAISGSDMSNFVDGLMDTFGSWMFWMPVIAFFLGFWILGAIVNRGRWAFWVIFSLFVGIAAYGGLVLGALMEIEFWSAPGEMVGALVKTALVSPAAFIALVAGREVTVWFGALVAKIGAGKQAKNAAAKKEYDDKLAAGPVLSR